MGEKTRIFFFFLKEWNIFMGGCFFRFSPDLPDLHLLNTCTGILKRVRDTRLTMSAVSFNRDLV